MELKDFIANALTNIVKGVEEANKVCDRFQLSSGFHEGKGISGQEVEFDLSIIVNETSEKSGKGGILVALANLGAGMSKENKTSETNANTHRIKFKVFVSEK